MLHPAHLNPPQDMDPNKLAWLSYWQEQRSDLVSQRNGDIILIVFSGLIFAFAYLAGDVRWGHYIGGCFALTMAAYFFYRRQSENKVQKWDDLGQLPYAEQCRMVHEQLLDKGKPGWFHLWYLLGFPVFWVIWNMPKLGWVWSRDMTSDLMFALITGVAINFVVQYQKRTFWQKGVDLADTALSE